MKLQGNINGVNINIEIPDEIERDEIFYEVVRIRRPMNGEKYCDSDGDVFLKAECLKYTSHVPILREIPRPSADWCNAGNHVASKKPVVVKYNDTIYTEDTYGKHLRWICKDDPLIGKRRFTLKEKDDVLERQKMLDELADEVAFKFQVSNQRMLDFIRQWKPKGK